MAGGLWFVNESESDGRLKKLLADWETNAELAPFPKSVTFERI
jgi:hypothetical protein